MGTFTEIPLYPKRTTTRGEVTARAKYTATTAGAIVTSGAGAPVAPSADFSCTKDGGTTGAYDLTFPACADIDLQFDIVSPAGTVNTCVITAKDANAGTASILLASGATAAYLASGDIIVVRHNATTEV